METSRIKLQFLFSEKNIIIFCILIIFMFNSPNLFLKDNFYPAFGYDSLDSYLIWNKILLASGKIFSANSTIINPAMGGLPRVCYPSEFSIEFWLYAIFKPHLAYAFNVLLIHLVAFWGMVLLLRKIFNKEYISIIYLVALSYSCLNFWPHAGIGVAGLPLLIYSYLIAKEKLILPIIIMFIYALYSNLVITGIFLFAVLLLDQLKKIINKEFNKKQFLFLSLLLLVYILSNYRLLLATINPIFVSIRTDFVIPTFGITDSLKTFIKMVFYEYGHNVKKPIVIVIITLVYFIYCYIKKITINSDSTKVVRDILILSGLSVLIQSEIVYDLYSRITLLKMIQLQRFYWLLPPLFYVLLFVVLREILNLTKKKMVVFSILIIQFVYVASNNVNWRQIVKTEIFGRQAGVITFNKFYSPELYKEIKKYIGKEQSNYRVASFGLQPAAALYNGFYTIDGYFGNYPKAYKDTFYKIIKEELNKNEEMKKFFLNWGSVCIILSDEMIKKLKRKGYIIPTFYKSTINEIKDLNIDTGVMRSLNCQYLFSAFKIANCSKLGLHFKKYFENAKSPYGIYLYSL